MRIKQNILALQHQEPPLALRWYFESTDSYPEPYLQFADKLRQDGMLELQPKELVDEYVRNNYEELNSYLSQVFDHSTSVAKEDSASSGLPLRTLEHQDYYSLEEDEAFPIVNSIGPGKVLLSDLDECYWDAWRDGNGCPPKIDGYKCVGRTPEDGSISYNGLEPVYEFLGDAYREDPVELIGIACKKDAEEDEDWLLPEEVELFEIDEDPVERFLRGRRERERTDSRFSRAGRRRKGIVGSDGVRRTYWVRSRQQQPSRTRAQRRTQINQERRAVDLAKSKAAETIVKTLASGFASKDLEDDFKQLPTETKQYISGSMEELNNDYDFKDAEIVDVDRKHGFVTVKSAKGGSCSVGIKGNDKIAMFATPDESFITMDYPEYGEFESTTPTKEIIFNVNNDTTTDKPRKGDLVERMRSAKTGEAVKAMWRSQLSNALEDGDVVHCSAASGDGRGSSREAIYRRMGFSDEVEIIDQELVAVVDSSQRRGLLSDPSGIESELERKISEEYMDWVKEKEEKEEEEEERESWEGNLYEAQYIIEQKLEQVQDRLIRRILEKRAIEPAIPALEELQGVSYPKIDKDDLLDLAEIKDDLDDLIEEIEGGPYDPPFSKKDVYKDILGDGFYISRLVSEIKNTNRSKRSREENLGIIGAKAQISAVLVPNEFLEKEIRKNKARLRSLDEEGFDSPAEKARLKYLSDILSIKESLKNYNWNDSDEFYQTSLDSLEEWEDIYQAIADYEYKEDAAPKKYAHISFTPPESVRKAAERGLEIRKKQPKSKRGGLTNKEASREGIGSGVQRAVNLKNGSRLSPKVVKQMKAFFDRHSAFKHKHKEEPNGKARQSWLQWGGDAGYSWAKKVVAQMEAADKEERQDALERFNLKYDSNLTLEELESDLSSMNPELEWVTGYNRNDSWVSGYVRYYRDRSDSKKKDLRNDARAPEDDISLSVAAALDQSQPIIEQWINELEAKLGKEESLEALLKKIPSFAEDLNLEKFSDVLANGNVVNYLMGLSLEDEND